MRCLKASRCSANSTCGPPFFRLRSARSSVLFSCVELAELTTGLQPNVVMLGQDHLEQILRTELQKLGCETEWGTTLLSFEQPKGGDCVHTSISRPGSEEDITESVTFDFLVGTDGARGIVRKSLGLTFLGETSNADRLVVGDVMVFGLDPKVGLVARPIKFTDRGSSFGICGERLAPHGFFFLSFDLH